MQYKIFNDFIKNILILYLLKESIFIDKMNINLDI